MIKLMNQPRSAGHPLAKPKDIKCLSYPIGLTQGTMNQNGLKSDARSEFVTSTCCHYAYAFSFIKAPTTWTTKDINDILLASTNYLASAKICCEQMEVPLTEENLINRFEIQNYTIDLKLPTASDVIGKILNTNNAPGICNAMQGLKTFFRRAHRACIFRSNAIHLLIWKTSGIFYVFDPRGRKTNCAKDTETGYASLICLETMKNLNCLIVYLSGVKSDEFYVIKELRVNSLTKTNRNIKSKCTKKNKNPDPTFITINEQMAILYGSINVAHACFKETRNCQTLTSCCIAYVYNLIHPPNTWTQKSVDKVLLFGNQLYQECVNGKIPEQFTIRHVPTIITLGPYRAGIGIRPYHSGGRLQHTVEQTASELIKALTLYFLDKSCALLQVDQLHFAIWKRGSVFYLFDPYGRNQSGKVDSLRSGVASLQIHSTLESMCSTMYANLIRIAEKERFYLHDLSSSILSEQCGDSSIVEVNDEQLWLNESIASLYTPSLDCVEKEANVENLCNLDSPTVSATQFIRPWQVMKGDAFQKFDTTPDDGDVEDEGDDEDDESEKANNDLGLEDDVYTALQMLGMTDEEIAAYLALGLSVDDMKKWFSAGVNPEDAGRLLKAGTTLNDYKEMKKLNLTIDDMLKLKELGISAEKFASLKAQGTRPDDMLAAIETEENAKKFKKLSLNVCEIDMLTSEGITAEQCERGMEQGLTFEEVRHAASRGIPAEEFSRQKDLGMNSVDIIRAKELNTTPEEYLKQKADGVLPEEEIADVAPPAQRICNEDEIQVAAPQPSKQGQVETQKDQEQPAKEKTGGPALEEKKDDVAAKDKKEQTPSKANEQISADDKCVKATQEKPAKETSEKGSKVDKPANEIQENRQTKDKPTKEMQEKPRKEEQEKRETETQEKRETETQEKRTTEADVQPEIQKKNASKQSSRPAAGKGSTIDIADSTEDLSLSRFDQSSNRAGGTSNESLYESDFPGHSISVVISEKDESLQKSPKERRLSDQPKFNLTVIKSAKMTPVSFQKLLQESFKVVDRVLILDSDNEPSCVAFYDAEAYSERQYFLYEGCDCNVHHIRRLVLDNFKDCMSRFATLNTMITHIIRRLKSSERDDDISDQRRGRGRGRDAFDAYRGRPNNSDEYGQNYARTLLDEQLEGLDKRFDDLLSKFQSLAERD